MSDTPAVAVVTGASRGLGAGLADSLARRGVRLGLCARTRPPVPAQADAVSRVVDVTDGDAVEAFLEEVVARLGPIDLWVNNAGVLDPIGPLAESEPAPLLRHLEINVAGVALGTRAFARHVRGRPGGGVLVNVSSGAATRAYEGWAVYCASKAAVDMLTEVVALEEAGHGLRAYALAPGHIDTDMQARIRSMPPEAFPAVDRFRRVHADRAFTPPEAVAAFICSLVRDPATAGGAVRQRVPGPTAGR